MSIWDDPEMQVNDEYVRFEKPGDAVTGTVLSVRAYRFDATTVAPQLLMQLDDGSEKTVTAGQVRLKATLAELRPEAGDRISITLTEIEKRSGGKELKHFEVQVLARAEQTPAPATATAAAAPSSTPPAVHAPTAPDTTPDMTPDMTPDASALAAAIAALSEEQKKALGLA
jgi:hypothetical protein